MDIFSPLIFDDATITGSTSSGLLTVSTPSSTILKVSGSGNVGIGTGAPSTRLSIRGGYQTSGLVLNEELNFATGTSSPDRAQIWWGDNSGWRLNFGTRDGSGNFVPRVTMVDTGNVGIGTVSPTRALDVRSSGVISHFSSSTTQALVDIVGTFNQLRLGSFSGTVGLAHGTVTVPQLSLDSAGNVGIGIGTASPSVRLEVSGSLGAPSYVPGFAGSSWRLDYSPTSSSLEVDNLTVRGTMKVYELLINQIRATNGTLFISSVGKVDTVQQSGSSTTYYLTFDTGSGNTLGHGFLVGDIIRAQRTNPSSSQFVYRSDMTVEGVSGNGRIVTASLTGSNPPSASYEFVRLGNRSTAGRQGTVYLTADDTNAPFIDVLDGITSHTEWNSASGSNKLKTRMGKLDGINNTPFGNLTGYGFYASGSAYLVGGINAAFGNIGGFAITQNALTGSGFFISGGAAANGFFISSSRFNVKGNGDVTGSNVLFTGGRIGGFTITNDVLSGTGFLLSGSATGTGFFISASNFNVKADGQITGSNVLFNGGRIGGFTITNDVLSGTGFLLSGSATGNGFFISASNFNVKANGQITGSTVLFTGGRIGGFTITDSVLSGTGFLLSGSATGTGFFISASNFNVKADGQVTGSNVLFNGGRIGGFTITNDVLSGTGFLLSGSASSTGFFISSSGFNVKGSGNITASAGLVGGWNLSTSSLSQGNVNLLATAVSGGLFVTSGSERILTVGDFADVTVTTSPGLFATASLFRSASNGTVSILSSSNSLTISRSSSIAPSNFVITTVTQSLGTIPAGRVLALSYTYADTTNYTSSAATVTWNSTSPSNAVSVLLFSGSPANTQTLSPTTSSIVTAGGLTGGKGTLNFTASLVNTSTYESGDTFSSVSVDDTVPFRVYNSSSFGKTLIYEDTFSGVSTNGTSIIRQSIPINYYGNNNTKIEFDLGDFGVLWTGSTTANFNITSSLNITGITSDIYVPAIFSASISSSGGTSLVNSYQHDSRSPYSKVYASSIPVPTQLTDARLIFTIEQLGSGSAYTNLPSYNISNILVSADVPKVNITRNQALFYNSPLQYIQWTTSSFNIKGDIDATSLTVRGTTNLLGPVNIEGDISAHPDVVGATDTVNTAGIVVQNLTFDEFGHTTGVSSVNLDGRYQAVGQYVTTNTTQTITGLKTILGQSPSGEADEIAIGLLVSGSDNSQDIVNNVTTVGIYAKAGNAISDAGTTVSTVGIYAAEGSTGGTTPANAFTYAGYFSGSTVTTKTGSFAHILPLTDNTGTVGTAASTWASGHFTNLTIDSGLSTATITTTGNVKLGDTTSDTHTITGSLGVSGSLALVGSQTITTNLTIDGNAKLGNATSDTHTITGSLGVSGSLALIGNATSTGNVTVTGNISASGNLNIDGNTVIGNSGADTLRIYSNDIVLNKGGAGSPHTIRNDNASSDLVFLVTSGNMVLSGSSTSNMSFVDAGTTNMFISSSGNVGIGTTTPRTPLQVNGQISGSSVRAAYSSSDGTAGITISITVLDDTSTPRTMEFKDGILVSYV